MTMHGKKIDKKYAQALFDAVQPPITHDAILEQLRQLEAFLKKEKKIFHFLSNPINDVSQKYTIAHKIKEAIDLNTLVFKFFNLLLKRNKMDILPGITREYQTLCYEEKGIAVVEITTAMPLDERNRQKLHAAMEEIMKKKIILSYSINPNLIGGIVAKSGSMVYDGSIQRQIDLIKEKILEAS